MAQNQDKQTFHQGKPCIKCTKMFGHPNFQDMCSLCFKKQKAQQKLQQHKPQQKQLLELKNQKQQKIVVTQEDLGTKKQEQIAGKCAKCQRKTKLLGYNCKHCSKEFCRLHRIPEEHQCEVDFVVLGRKQIKTDNPNISNKKIEHI